VKSFFIEKNTFVNYKLKYSPIMQCMKSNGLSRINLTSTNWILGPFSHSARFSKVLKCFLV